MYWHFFHLFSFYFHSIFILFSFSIFILYFHSLFSFYFHSNFIACRFNDSIVPATVITSNSISCITPPHVRGNASISISLNGKDFSPSTLVYTYDLSARALQIVPLSGPITGGTVISVNGLNFDGKSIFHFFILIFTIHWRSENSNNIFFCSIFWIVPLILIFNGIIRH